MSKNNTAGIEEALDIDADIDAGIDANVDDDDDIVDLLEVVKPGTLLLQDGVFPDPTPVDHVVDYNESLDLPGMEDLDAFLSSLGVTPESDSPAPSGGAPSVSDPDLEALDAVPAVDAASAGNQEPDEDFLDSLLAEEKNDDTAESVPAPEESDAPDPSDEPGLDEDFLTDAPSFAEDRQPMMAEESESGVHGHAAGVPGVTANHGFATVSEASASLTPEELDLLREGMPTDQEPEFDGDVSLDAAFTEALDAAMAAEGDSAASASDVPFDAVRDAAFDALMKAGDVAGDQNPSAAPGSPEEVSEAVFDAEEKEPSDESAARNAEAEKDMEEPRGTLFPEPVVEDAPLNEAAPDAAATVPPGSASRFDEVDLNELDALLDTMLASAPSPDPVPSASPAGEEALTVADAPAPSGELSAADNGGVSVKLESDIAALRLDVENLREALAVLPVQAARLAKIEERLPAPEEPETGEEASVGPGLADTLQRLEERILILETRSEEAFTRDAQAQASLDALDERIAGLAAGLEGIERRFADFSANIDKVAAKAAATVLREEIAALAEQDY